MTQDEWEAKVNLRKPERRCEVCYYEYCDQCTHPEAVLGSEDRGSVCRPDIGAYDLCDKFKPQKRGGEAP